MGWGWLARETRIRRFGFHTDRFRKEIGRFHHLMLKPPDKEFAGRFTASPVAITCSIASSASLRLASSSVGIAAPSMRRPHALHSDLDIGVASYNIGTEGTVLASCNLPGSRRNSPSRITNRIPVGLWICRLVRADWRLQAPDANEKPRKEYSNRRWKLRLAGVLSPMESPRSVREAKSLRPYRLCHHSYYRSTVTIPAAITASSRRIDGVDDIP